MRECESWQSPESQGRSAQGLDSVSQQGGLAQLIGNRFFCSGLRREVAIYLATVSNSICQSPGAGCSSYLLASSVARACFRARFSER